MQDKAALTMMDLMVRERKAFEAYLSALYPGGSFLADQARTTVVGSGKRLRPQLTMAAAMTGDYDRDRVFPVAAAIETLHTATLVHDDVIDGAAVRRRKKTAYAEHGSHVAVYLGDYLLARALKLLADSPLPKEDLTRLAGVVEQICAGDLAQYLGRNKIPGGRTYLKRIVGKTGLLFAASAATGASLAEAQPWVQNRLWSFGLRYGAAFQIRDDLLDLGEAGDDPGKPVGRDLLEGIVTLPMLLLATKPKDRQGLEAYLQGPKSQADTWHLVSAARKTGSVQRAKQILNGYLDRCQTLLADLPDSPGTQHLAAMTEWLRPDHMSGIGTASG